MANKSNPLLDDRIAPIVEACAPLKVTVKLKTIKDKYYLHFDGSKTYKDPHDWDKYWVSFDQYVRHLLNTNGFESATFYGKGSVPENCHIVAYLGSLFDFLKAGA